MNTWTIWWLLLELLSDPEATPRDMAAVEFARRGVEPADIEARHNLGVAQVESGRFTEAIQSLQVDLERRPNHPLVHHYLGRAWNRDGDTGRAVRSYRRALEILPDLPEAREALAGLQPTPEKR